jgi:hypothetical protein
VTAAVAFAAQWPLFYLAPVLTVFLLAHPPPEPPVRATGHLGAAILVSTALGLVFAHLLLPYPLVHVVLLALALLHIYYRAHLGSVRVHTLLALIAILLLPMMTLKYQDLASGVMLALSFLGSTLLAALAFLAATMLLPDPKEYDITTQDTHQPVMAPRTAMTAAIRSTLVLLPVAVLFLGKSWANELLVLVFVAILSLLPDTDRSQVEASKFLIANLIGAAAAFLFYWLMVAAPEFHFFVVLMSLTALAFSVMIFSTGALARYMVPACVALMVLIAGSMVEHTGYMDNIVLRIVFIGMAALYVVIARALLDRLFVGSPESASR